MSTKLTDVNICDVMAFATERHKGQLRADGRGHIEHCIRVADLVALYKPSKNNDILRAGALLHDTLEDTYTSFRELSDRFGLVVASLVMEVTSATFMPRLVGKQIYLAHKMRYMSSYALVIKLADRLDNLTDLAGLTIERISKTFFDSVYLINYLESKRLLTDAQSSLVGAIRAQLDYINKTHKFTDQGFVADTDIDQD